MMPAVFVKSYDAPPVSVKEILRYAGAGDENGQVRALAESCLAESESALRYSVCYSYFPIQTEGEIIDLGFFKTDSASLRKNLAACEGVWVFAATVGLGQDRLIARYRSTAPSRALMLEAVGNERVEALCDLFCREIAKKEAAEGRKTHPRFSVGYGDLPLEGQKAIFAVLEPSKRIGLSLNESLLMTPQKSVTALIGVSK